MIRAIDKWLLPYLLQSRASVSPDTETHVILTVCDHFEPFHDTDLNGALVAMGEWHKRWPKIVRASSDSSGVGPRHTFFYPVEQYDAKIIESLTQLCRDTGSEVEVHLHHHDDTASGLQSKLTEGLGLLRSHGLLPSDSNGAIRFGFIHGNWALDNSDPKGKNCGVSDEIGILRRLGCYADFTMPSAPHGSQTNTINSLYYAKDTPAPKSHNRGIPVAIRSTANLRDQLDMLLMIQGPLGLNLKNRKYGLLPKVENAELSGANPATKDRFELWRQLAPSMGNNPNWIFVKLHTHGGIARNYDSLLGKDAFQFHEELRKKAALNAKLFYHYATAREMTNMIHAVEDGLSGNPSDYRNYLYKLTS